MFPFLHFCDKQSKDSDNLMLSYNEGPYKDIGDKKNSL